MLYCQPTQVSHSLKGRDGCSAVTDEDERKSRSAVPLLQVLVMMALWSSCQQSISTGWWLTSALRPWRAAVGSPCSEHPSAFWQETTNSYLLPSKHKSKKKHFFFSLFIYSWLNNCYIIVAVIFSFEKPAESVHSQKSILSSVLLDLTVVRASFSPLCSTGLLPRACPSVSWRDLSRCTETPWCECSQFSTAWTAPSWSGLPKRCTREG